MADEIKNEEQAPKSAISKELESNETLQSAVGFFKKYQLYIGIALCAVLAYVLYSQFAGGNGNAVKELKAENDVMTGVSMKETDSFDVALNGGANGMGLLQVINKNKGTQAANIARMEAGVCYLKIGKPAEAFKMFDDAGGFGTQINAKRLNLMGDAKSELGTQNGKVDNSICKDAIGYYEKAANAFTEDENSAIYLLKAAQLSEKIGNLEDAKKHYATIKDKYPTFAQIQIVEKSLGRLGVEN